MAGIFICYRRTDAEGWAGRLYDSLKAELGRAKIFRDIDDIPPGVEFDAYISNAVGSCDVLIALIGPRWLAVTDKNGRRRLDDPKDFTRLEILTALKRNVRVIPALIGGMRMPDGDELPEDLKPLARRQAYELSDTRWNDDCRKLARVLIARVDPHPWGKTVLISMVLAAAVAAGYYMFKGLNDQRVEPVPPPSKSAASVTFSNPKLGEYRLDMCRSLAADCDPNGYPAASSWCQTKGYSKAVDLQIEKNVNARGAVTKTIGDGRVCRDGKCDSFKFITCQ